MQRAPARGRIEWLALCTAIAVGALVVLATSAQSLPPDYVGDEVCAGCHEDLLPHYDQTTHAKVLNERNARTEQMRYGCESCHGPGREHVEAGGGRGEGGADWITFQASSGEDATRQNAVCLECHAGSERLFWEGSPHQSRGAPCTSCHNVMRNVSKDKLLARVDVTQTCAQCHLLRRSQTYRNVHMPMRDGLIAEGWMDCASCHNPHGTVTPSLIKAQSVNDNCYSCHADKRGPFLWEHAPVVEDCTNCHEPHGSITQNMLKMAPPRLCQTCHIATLHPSQPFSPTDRRVFGRSCLNCHTNIHGSNHPSGAFFTR